MDELEKTAQETAEETGGMAPDAGEQQVPAGDQGVPGGEEDFETLIRGRYKGEFDARVRRILDGRLLDTSGTLGTAETGFSWSAESGDLGLYTPEHKYLSRLELRLKTAAGSTVKAYVCYDGDGAWEQVGGVSGEVGQTRGAVLQVRPRRCGHLRLKLAGDGPCRVYSAAAVYEKGSDGP